MPNVCLTIEYDGSRFHGWQIQPQVRTIQGELTRLLEMITREKIAVVHASGRTDAGVHAWAQVVNFNLEHTPNLDMLKQSINGLFKKELVVLAAKFVPDDFHARQSAKFKVYRYRILNRHAPAVLDRDLVWHLGYQLNLELMNGAAKYLLGTHDFSAFRSKDCGSNNTIKTINRLELISKPPYLDIVIEGSGFLKNMVRIIVGTLVDIGRGYLPASRTAEILASKNRAAAGVTAPAHGLYLESVIY